jgi:hypothetical protein
VPRLSTYPRACAPGYSRTHQPMSGCHHRWFSAVFSA